MRFGSTAPSPSFHIFVLTDDYARRQYAVRPLSLWALTARVATSQLFLVRPQVRILPNCVPAAARGDVGLPSAG